MSFETNLLKAKQEEERAKPGKLKKLAKKAGLVLGLGATIGLGAATLEGLKNKPHEDMETSAEKEHKGSDEAAEQELEDLQDLEELNRKMKDQAKIDELRRFIARESKPGDELYSVGKDPFAVPGEELLPPEKSEYGGTVVEDSDFKNKHIEDFFEKVLGEKYKVRSEKSNKGEKFRFEIRTTGELPRNICYISVDEGGRYTISDLYGKPRKTVDESQLEKELDDLKKKYEEGKGKDPFYYDPFV